MQKILPDVSFLAQWKDKIEAVVITHGGVGVEGWGGGGAGGGGYGGGTCFLVVRGLGVVDEGAGYYH